MRKLFVLFSTVLLALGIAGTASAAALNWSGTFTVDMMDFGRGSVSGGGVATAFMTLVSYMQSRAYIKLLKDAIDSMNKAYSIMSMDFNKLIEYVNKVKELAEANKNA